MKNYLKVVFILLTIPFFTNNADAQIFKKKKKEAAKIPAPAKKKPKGKIKDYKEIITKKAKSEEGLFTVHTVEDKYYFEIPTDILEREVLVVSRIAGTVKGLNFGGAGMKSRPQQVIRWQKVGDQILLRSVSHSSVASYEEPIYKSVKSNNTEPIVMAFDIKAIKKDTSKTEQGYVIDVKSLFTTDVAMIGALSSGQRRNFGIRRLDSKRSMISGMRAFPENVEIRHTLTYDGSKLPSNYLTNTLTLDMNQSFVLLPEEPMKPRLYDNRVGYFSVSTTDYSSTLQKAAAVRMITKWRLEPKDPEAYANGELVEPVKQIVYYIDPATPKQWVPFLKKGIEDWQPAFEAAGFKNAIIAKEAPTKEEDPDWSPEDVRYSVIRYISTDIQNAQGPHVHDPRTGEILESDILWYHNVMNLLRNWYFTQTAAINTDAQKAEFRDEVMGELIRFVCAHEVGHTLGLPHNMGSSAAFPVDSLRSAHFTQKMGTAPSIMDYARFNYVAQPEDKGVRLMPMVGIYDKWSIKWGYAHLDNETAAEDAAELNKWVVDKKGDWKYRYGMQRGNPFDPSAQTEDLGDDAMKASAYGIENLKRILPEIEGWIEEDGKDYKDAKELYGQVMTQFGRYMRHVRTNIGGVYEEPKSMEEEGVVYTHIPEAKQRRAVQFLHNQLFETPEWMIREEQAAKFQHAGLVNQIRGMQVSTLNQIFDFSRLQRMIENEAMNGSSAYSVLELFDDMRNGIFSEVKSGQKIDVYRRNLQRAYLERLEYLMTSEQPRFPPQFADFIGITSVDVSQSDIRAVVRGELKRIKSMAQSGTGADTMSQYHLEDLAARVDDILEGKKK
ncbi:MAG: zinc-dependent metalloprotease [Saprospiraceae bacterium]